MQRTDLFGVSYTRGVRAKLEHAPPSVRRRWVEVGPSLRWVLEDSGEFPDLPELDQLTSEQVVELGGGVDAATYLVRCPRRDVVAALKNDEGQIVEPAAEYLDRSPASARELGRAVGAELHRMHQAVDKTGFGNFADSPGSG